MNPSGIELNEEQRTQPAQQDRVHGQEIAGQHAVSLGFEEHRPRQSSLPGEASIPWRHRIAHTLDAARRTPTVDSSPWIWRYPHDGLSPAMRKTSATVPAATAGRPARPWR